MVARAGGAWGQRRSQARPRSGAPPDDDEELNVLGAHLGPSCWPAAARMIESGRLPLDDIVTHQLPISRFQEGFDLVVDGSTSIRVTLVPDRANTTVGIGGMNIDEYYDPQSVLQRTLLRLPESQRPST